MWPSASTTIVEPRPPLSEGFGRSCFSNARPGNRESRCLSRESRNARPKRNADGLGQLSVWAPQQPTALQRPREPLAPSGSRDVRPKRSAARVQAAALVQPPTLVPQHAQSVHPGDGQERDKCLALGTLPCSHPQRHVFHHEDQPHGNNSHVDLQQQTLSVHHRRPVSGRVCVQLRPNCIPLHPLWWYRCWHIALVRFFYFP